jgi:hypothetical protein
MNQPNSSEPIARLPLRLCPTHSAELVRVGSVNDGGYAVARSSLRDTKFLYGLGVNTDWEFERDFQERSGSQVECFDHTVTSRFWAKHTIWEIINLVAWNRRHWKDVKRLFLARDYYRFFDGQKAIHHRKMIGPEAMGGVPIAALLAGKPDNTVFMKIDIEGWEYRMLDELSQNSRALTGTVIEFHDCDLHLARIEQFLERFALHLVHIHANNFSPVSSEGVPQTLELTFAREAIPIKPPIVCRLPNPEVDHPNCAEKEDYVLLFE